MTIMHYRLIMDVKLKQRHSETPHSLQKSQLDWQKACLESRLVAFGIMVVVRLRIAIISPCVYWITIFSLWDTQIIFFQTLNAKS